MRRLAVLVMAALLAMPGTAMAQEPDDLGQMLAFAEITGTGSQTFHDTIPTIVDGPEARASLRAEIARQRTALLDVDPSACWIATYVRYIESLVLLDTAVVLYDTAPAAFSEVLSLATASTSAFNADELYACSGA